MAPCSQDKTIIFDVGCTFGYFRYLNPPNNWVACSLESRELMALCLKRLKNLSKVKLVDANFVWTEPHSKRIKVRLTIITDNYEPQTK